MKKPPLPLPETNPISRKRVGLAGRLRGGSSFLLQKGRNGFVNPFRLFHFLKGRSIVGMEVDDRRECCGKRFDNVESL